MPTLLIDADVLIYRAACGVEHDHDWGDGVWTLHSDSDEAKDAFAAQVEELLRRLPGAAGILCLSDRDRVFRHDIWPSYKGGRKRRPLAYKPLRDWVEQQTNWPTYLRPGLEADDVLGILATHRAVVPGHKIVVSIDKDLKQIPGDHWNLGETITEFTVTEEEGDFQHLLQTLTGDATDNYPGCPGIGPVRAVRILEQFDPPDRWAAICQVYAKAGLTETDALVQARIARILRASDYNFKRKEPILWTP